jgi:hypothetical protein
MEVDITFIGLSVTVSSASSYICQTGSNRRRLRHLLVQPNGVSIPDQGILDPGKSLTIAEVETVRTGGPH